MVTLKITRLADTDATRGAIFAILQELIAHEARKHGLETDYTISSDGFVCLVVKGRLEEIALLVEGLRVSIDIEVHPKK